MIDKNENIMSAIGGVIGSAISVFSKSPIVEFIILSIVGGILGKIAGDVYRHVKLVLKKWLTKLK